MQRILKLTPGTIKKIIAEEREKLKAEHDEKLLEEKRILLQKLKLLKKIKNRQLNSLSEAKQLHNLKKKVVSTIKKGKK